MYPEIMVVPMREELTRLGIEELRTAAQVDQTLPGTGTTMVVVNSICGCAAGRMRPAVRLARHRRIFGISFTRRSSFWTMKRRSGRCVALYLVNTATNTS